MPESFKRKVYELVEVMPAEDGGGKQMDWFDRFVVALIILNVVAVILETEAALASLGPWFAAFEYFSVGVFTIEYLLRLWSCTADPRYAHPVKGRLRFATRPMQIIDLIAILPTYLPLITTDLRFIRSLRLLRILRVLKIGRYSEAVNVLANVFKSRGADLAVMFFVLVILLIVAAGVVYYAENDAQPDKFSSIPAAMWWAVITLTTIGYGDVYPITPLGKLLGGIIAVCGIGIVALPTAIIATGFADELKKRAETGSASGTPPGTCPHCGSSLDATGPHARDA
ncbi:MAG: ion transporter [Tepidisphaeraceae bacterium]